jgi:Coenzyme PQQ synthesis protein D (PqqD)
MKKITNFDTCPRRQEQIIVQKGSKEVLLFNMDDGSYYALNEVGNRIWELCDGTHKVAQLVCMLAKEYNAPADIIETDILELLEDLRSKNLIVECSGDRMGFDASGALQGSP